MTLTTLRRGFGTVNRLPSGRYGARYTGPDLVRHTARHTFGATQRRGWLPSDA